MNISTFFSKLKPRRLTCKFRQQETNYALIAFLITFVGMGVVMLVKASVMRAQDPNFIYSTMKSDAYHQYFPFFKAYRRALLSGDSLLFSWDVGMGLDYLGLIAYYLGSPLNLLSILVPESWLTTYFTMLNPLRMGLAAMFFTLFLNKVFGHSDFTTALFGCFYATCAWVMGYLWNSMWVDTFALLPLVLMGMVSLLRERKFILYTVSLFLSVFINYYIGLFTCIFTLLAFICYEICHFTTLKRFWEDLSLMALFTVLAIGMTAILSLPTLASLQTTSSGNNVFPKKFELNIVDKDNFLGLLEGMKQVATNTFSMVEPNYVATEGLPNIYCGVFANIFIVLLLTTKDVHWRDRICSVLLLLFVNASFVIRQLDYIWHGFHFTNMIPYRFSFVYSFIMLYLAYRAWHLRDKLRFWQIPTAAAFTLLMYFTSNAHKDAVAAFQSSAASKDFSIDTIIPFVNLLLIALYCTALMLLTLRAKIKDDSRKRSNKENTLHQQKFQKRKAFAAISLTVIIAAELVLNIISFGIFYGPTNLYGYPRGGKDAALVLSMMKELEDDTLFYRTEVTSTQTFNDGALNGYNGITTFTSSANAKMATFMSTLGYGGAPTWNRYAFKNSSPVCNLFFNLKYMVERNGKVVNNPYFEDIYSSGAVHLLKNNYYLPLGFMTAESLSELNFANGDTGNKFGFQNDLMSAALGEKVEPWNILTGENIAITTSGGATEAGLNYSTISSYSGYDYIMGSASGGTATYQFTAPSDGLSCLYFYTYPNKASISISHSSDGENFTHISTESESLAFSRSVCDVKAGDIIKVSVACAANKKNYLRIQCAILDQEIMDYALERLSQSTLELTTFKNTFIEGTVDCKQDGLLYTSIPQAGTNWHVYVDGKEEAVSLIGEAMVGVKLTKGTHTVTFRYENGAYETGRIITLLSILAFAALIGLHRYYKKKYPEA